MDAELAELFSDEEDVLDTVSNAEEHASIAPGQVRSESHQSSNPLPQIDDNLPFHRVPWGLLLARKHGIDTDEILHRLKGPKEQ